MATSHHQLIDLSRRRREGERSGEGGKQSLESMIRLNLQRRKPSHARLERRSGPAGGRNARGLIS